MTVNKSKFICIGEILWDKLPYSTVAGGAPFNVAIHLKRWGCEVDFISCVGVDWDGDKLIKSLESEFLSPEFIQRNGEHITGKVNITLSDDGKPEYDIVEPVAWDYIRIDENNLSKITRDDYVVFGSLAQRNNVSRTSIRKLLDSQAKKIFDVNLREPFYSKEIIYDSLKKADILKLNDDELEIISSWFDVHGDMALKLETLAGRFSIDRIVLTLGEKGALSFYNGDIFHHKGFKLQVKDTVGAGDAFLGAYLSKLNDDIQEVDRLKFANAVAAYIASQSGALPALDLHFITRLMDSKLV